MPGAGNVAELPVQASPAPSQQQCLLSCRVPWPFCARSKAPPALQAPGAVALLRALCSCLAAQDLIHHSPALRKGPKSKPQAYELSAVFSNFRQVVAFPRSMSGFPFPSSGYLQAFQFLKGRAGLYYGPGQCLTQEGPTLIRVSCDYCNTSTANKMHLKQKKRKKGSDAPFPVNSYLGKAWERWDFQPEVRWPDLTHAKPLSCPCSAAS